MPFPSTCAGSPSASVIESLDKGQRKNVGYVREQSIGLLDDATLIVR